MEKTVRDLRQALRQIAKTPAFAAVTVLTLALGIGANTAMFSLVDSLLLRPLPLPHSSQISALTWKQKDGQEHMAFSTEEYHRLRERTGDVFLGLTGVAYGMDGLSSGGHADRIMTYYVSGNFFSILGVQPALGRMLLPGEGEVTSADPVVVLGYHYWASRFQADPRVIGSQVLVDGRPFTVIGVAPPRFFGLNPFIDIQAYLPLGMMQAGTVESGANAAQPNRNVNLFAVRRPDVTLARAQAKLYTLPRNLMQGANTSNQDIRIEVFPESSVRMGVEARKIIPIISAFYLGLAAVVLLLACVNIANLFLARMTLRIRDMAVRRALGASRMDLIRLILAESVLLSLISGIGGIAIGAWIGYSLSSLNLGFDIAFHLDFSLDWRIFCYTVAASVAGGFLIALLAVFRISRQHPAVILRAGGRAIIPGRHRLRSALVVAQVAFSVLLLTVAGLFLHSLQRAQGMDLGFDPKNVVNLSMDPHQIGLDDEQSLGFYSNLLDRIQAVPGVESAAIASTIPMGFFGDKEELLIPNQVAGSDSQPTADVDVVSPGYFRVLRIPLLQGRFFTEADHEGAPRVAIINSAMAQKFWKTTAVGRQFRLAKDSKNAIEVVGVVADSRYQGIAGPIGPLFYLPFGQNYADNSLETLQVRVAHFPEQMLPQLTREVHRLSPDLPFFDVKTMSQALNTINGYLVFRIAAGIAALLGSIGLFLALVGVYGVISYVTNQRSQEIGVRIALGATGRDILRLIMRHGAIVVSIGLLIGLGIAASLAPVVGSLLTLSALDPVIYLIVCLLVGITALAACYIPGRRATRVMPSAVINADQ